MPWSVLLFWPAVALSVLVASFGLAYKNPIPLVVAAALVGPMSAYLALAPRFFVVGLFPVGVYLVAAVATRRNHRGLGAALVAGNTAFFALVAGNTAFFGWLAVTIFG